MLKPCIYFLLALLTTGLSGQNGKDKTIERVKDLIAKYQFDSAQHIAESHLLQTDPSSEPVLFLRATSTLITTYVKKGSFMEGVKVGDDLLTVHPNIIGLDDYSTCEFYTSLGEAYHLTQSNNKKALSYFDQALVFYEKLTRPDAEMHISILRGIGGTYYYMGEYEKSIASFEKAHRIIINSENKERTALNFRSIGNSYWGMRDYENAAESYNKSLGVLFSQNPVDSLTVGQVLHAMGYIYMDQEDFQTAYATFSRASNLLERKHPNVSSPLVWVYGDVGRALIELGKYDSALVWLQKALNANVFELHQADYYLNPPLININDDFQHFMILKLKGQAFFSKYLESGNKKDLEGMVDCFIQSDEQVDNIRRSIAKAEDQSTIAYYSTELYSRAIDATVHIYQLIHDESFMEYAHYFMEKQKITQVHLKFLEASAKTSGLLPPDILNQDKEMLDQISSLKSKIKSQLLEESDSVKATKNQLFQAQENYEKFVTSLKREYPSYHSSRFDLTVASLAEIQERLSTDHPKRAIVTYYDFGKKLRTSILTKDTIVIHTMAHEQDLFDLVDQFRKSLTTPSGVASTNLPLSELLTSAFNAALFSEIDQLTFVLDPALQLVPIELVQMDGKYLFEDFDIGYHFSATMFLAQQINRSSSKFMGFAPSFDSLGLQALPGAEKEILSILEVYDGLSFLQKEASEAQLKKSLTNAGLLHFATHAEIDEQNPESSFLQFGTSETDDGKLHFFEIYNLNLNAQLVTLSACNTGFGKIQKGEGVMSLSRAFAYAGVPSTVVSLWPASDKSTPELMKYFYQNLKEGQPKDVALNNARKQYLATAQGKARHPFYWGGFVLIGDNSPIEEDTNLLVYIIPSVLVVGMILAVYRRRKQRA